MVLTNFFSKLYFLSKCYDNIRAPMYIFSLYLLADKVFPKEIYSELLFYTLCKRRMGY